MSSSSSSFLSLSSSLESSFFLSLSFSLSDLSSSLLSSPSDFFSASSFSAFSVFSSSLSFFSPLSWRSREREQIVLCLEISYHTYTNYRGAKHVFLAFRSALHGNYHPSQALGRLEEILKMGPFTNFLGTWEFENVHFRSECWKHCNILRPFGEKAPFALIWMEMHQKFRGLAHQSIVKSSENNQISSASLHKWVLAVATDALDVTGCTSE